MQTIAFLTPREVTESYLTAEEFENVMKPVEEASVLPLKVYSSRAFFEREVDAALRPCWHAVTRVEQLKEQGSYVTAKIVGEPIIVIRGKDGVIRAMSNVCRHRGSQLLSECGVAKAIVCPYHTWTYNLDGSLRGAPHMNKVEDFDRKSVQLPEFKVELWNGFVFVNLDPEAAPLGPEITDLTEAMKPFGLENWTSEPWKEASADWNWKVSLENFTEAYHHVGIHRNSIGKVSLAENAIYEKTNNTYSLFYVHIEAEGEYLPDSEGHPFPNVPGLPEKFHSYSPVLNIYPTFHLVLGPNFALWLQFEINGVDDHKLVWSWLVPPGAKDLPDYKERLLALDAMMGPIVTEDLTFMPQMKAAVNSRSYEAGRYCDQERAVHQMHQWLVRKMSERGNLLAPA